MGKITKNMTTSFPWKGKILIRLLLGGVMLVAAPQAVANPRGHAAAVSVTTPTANFTEADMEGFDDDDYWLLTCPVILEPNGGTGRPLLVKVTVDYSGRDGYTLPACPFTRRGYTFAGWDAYDGCYPALEGGYEYRKGDKSAGGGYTGTYQPGFLYEVCSATAFRAKWKKGGQGGGSVDVPAEWRKARTLSGVYGELCGEHAEGTAQLKCGKANRQGIAKVSLTITPFSGQKRTYRAVAVDVSQSGEIEVRWPQQSYAVTIHRDGSFFGEPIYGSIRPACTPNAVWSADVGGELYQTAYFTFEEDNGFWEDQYRDSLKWAFGDSSYLKINEAFYRTPIYMNGRKWTFEKNSTVRYSRKWLKDGWPYLPECDCAAWTLDTAGGTKMNVHALKLTYAYKTGIFKGGYYIYGGSGKKVKATVKGIVVDGVGYATVSANGYGSWTVEMW